MGIHFREPDSYVQILEITPATRRGIEDAIERLIALLDTLDPDFDLEPDTDDEENGDLEATNEDGGDILDEPHDPRDYGDYEPDLEPDADDEEPGDLEPDADNEPSLGWPQAGFTFRWEGADFDDGLLG